MDVNTKIFIPVFFLYFVLLNISLRRINRGGWADEGVILMDSCSCRERRLISFDAELREKTGAESG